MSDENDLYGMLAVAQHLRKYRTTLEHCGCPTFSKATAGTTCEHVAVAMLLVGGKMRCAHCGQIGQRLTPELRCEFQCTIEMLDDMCCICGLAVFGYKHEQTVIDLYAHSGTCAGLARERETDRLSIQIANRRERARLRLSTPLARKPEERNKTQRT